MRGEPGQVVPADDEYAPPAAIVLDAPHLGGTSSRTRSGRACSRTRDSGIDPALPETVLEIFLRGQADGHGDRSLTSLINTFTPRL